MPRDHMQRIGNTLSMLSEQLQAACCPTTYEPQMDYAELDENGYPIPSGAQEFEFEEGLLPPSPGMNPQLPAHDEGRQRATRFPWMNPNPFYPNKPTGKQRPNYDPETGFDQLPYAEPDVRQGNPQAPTQYLPRRGTTMFPQRTSRLRMVFPGARPGNPQAVPPSARTRRFTWGLSPPVSHPHYAGYSEYGDTLDYNLNEQRGFEGHLDANPLDVTAHGGYADWLREHGADRQARFHDKMHRSVGGLTANVKPPWQRDQLEDLMDTGSYSAYADYPPPPAEYDCHYSFESELLASILSLAHQFRRTGPIAGFDCCNYGSGEPQYSDDQGGSGGDSLNGGIDTDFWRGYMPYSDQRPGDDPNEWEGVHYADSLIPVAYDRGRL